MNSELAKLLEEADYLYPDPLSPVYAIFSAIFWDMFKRRFIQKELKKPFPLVSVGSTAYFEAPIAFNETYFWKDVKPQFFRLKNGSYLAIQLKEESFKVIAPIMNGKEGR